MNDSIEGGNGNEGQAAGAAAINGEEEEGMGLISEDAAIKI